MQRCSLKCFGVGDGSPSADRSHSAFLYRFEDAAVLVDCGEPLSRSYKGSRLSYDLIDRILLSHLHFDHVGGFFMFMQSLWLEGRKKRLVVHAPADGIRAIRQMLQAACIFDELLPFPLAFEPLDPTSAVAFANVRVTPFPTSHLARLRELFQVKYPQNFAAFSFLIESCGLRIGHTADVGDMNDVLPLLEKPLDLLVCELAHLPPEELFRFLRGRDVKRIQFVHLAREFWQDIQRLRARAREMLAPIETAFPSDGDEFVF